MCCYALNMYYCFLHNFTNKITSELFHNQKQEHIITFFYQTENCLLCFAILNFYTETD